MNKIILKSTFAIAAVMGGLAAAPAAHAVAVAGALAAFADAADVYRVTCPLGTSRITGSILDVGFGNNGTNVNLAFFDTTPPGLSPVASDAENVFPLSVPSGQVNLIRGPGQYYMYVWHSGNLNAENYVANYDCRNAAGGILASARLQLQNQ